LEAEKKLFGDDFKEYITPSYRKRIDENRKFADKMAKRDAEADKADVTSQKDFSKFYQNLSNQKNVAFGGQQSESSDDEKNKDDEDRRSPSPDTKADRAKRKRERADADMREAKRLKEQRETEKNEKTKALQDEYSKHQTGEEEKDSAKERFLERKKKKEEELARLRAAAASESI
jgi:hypothetical protein